MSRINSMKIMNLTVRTQIVPLVGFLMVKIEQTISVPVDASRMQVHLAFTGSPKQAGVLYIDDVNIIGKELRP